MKWRTVLILATVGVIGLIGRYAPRLWHAANDPHTRDMLTWRQADPTARADLIIAKREPCPGAPFILPSDGWIGLYYADPRPPYTTARPHQGIDIFSDAPAGVVPVYAAYDGYVRREAGWISSVIQRIPSDPLQPDRQIWLYYTHMADREGHSLIEPPFVAGGGEVRVPQGTLLGYTGDYSGAGNRPIWVHLHFSVVQDDGRGRYLNELEIANTLDPTPWLGLTVSYSEALPGRAVCNAPSPR